MTSTMELGSLLKTAVKSVHVWYVICHHFHHNFGFSVYKPCGDHFILRFIFSISFSCRMEMWFVHPFPVLPCLVKTPFIVLETVAHGKQPA